MNDSIQVVGSAPLTRADLDLEACDEPNCTHDHSILYFHVGCHPNADLQVRYCKATGTLEVMCAECDRLAAVVQVAAELPGGLQ